MTNFLHFFL